MASYAYRKARSQGDPMHGPEDHLGHSPVFNENHTAQQQKKAETDWTGQGTILIADDEETVRVVTQHMLELMGFKAIAATDGREAIAIFREKQSEITCVLLDLTMPHVDGEEAYREMRRIDRNVRVILSSGYNEQEVAQRFEGEGLDGFIQKPFRFEVLRATLRQVLGG